MWESHSPWIQKEGVRAANHTCQPEVRAQSASSSRYGCSTKKQSELLSPGSKVGRSRLEGSSSVTCNTGIDELGGKRRSVTVLLRV